MNRRGWIASLLAQCFVRRPVAVATIVTTLGAVAIDLVAPLLVRAAVDLATGEPTAPDVTLTVIVVALVVAAVVRYACQFGRRMSAGALAVSVQDRLRREILDTLLHLDGRSRDEIRTGQIVSRSISDLQIVQGLLAMAPLALGGAVQAVLAFVVMAWLSPLLTLVAVAVVPLLVLLVYASRRRLFAATWSAQQAAADVAGHVEETVTGVRVVKGFGQEERVTDRLAALSSRLYGMKLRTARISAFFTPTMTSIPQLGMVVVIGLGGWLTLRGTITAGTFLAFSTYLATMTGLARVMTNLVVNAQLAKASVTRVYDVIAHPRDPAYESDETAPEGRLGIEFDDVHFAYDDTPVLDGLDLSVAPGECVAVIGGPGSGKSTLAHLVAGVYRPSSGSVTITGDAGRADVGDLHPDALAEALAVVDDEPFLYSDTVAANIALGSVPERDVDRRAVEAAAHAAAADFAASLDHGYDTTVGERGLALSGGQRQRVALARALHADARVLVLDDATSAVDAVTESRILRRLRDDGATMLVLAHRSSTLAIADRVAVLQDGRVSDIGTVAELTARSVEFNRLMTSSEPTDSPRRDVDQPLDLSVDDLWPSRSGTETVAGRTTVTGVSTTEPAAAAVGRRTGGGPMAGALGAMAATPEIEAAVAALPPADEKPDTDDAAARAERSTFGLLQILRPVRALLILLIGTIAVDTLVGLAFPSIARHVLDADTTGVVITATGVGVALVAVAWIAGRVNTIVAARAGERVLFSLRIRSYAHLQRLGLDYYERELSGRIMTRMTTDVDALSGFLQTGLSSAVVSLLTLVGVLVALIFTDWAIALAVLPIFPVLIVATVWFRRVSSAAYTRTRELVSAVNADFQENIAGLSTTRGYRHIPVAVAAFGERSQAWYRARMTSQRAVATYFPFIQFCADLATAVAVGVGAQQIASGTLQPGTLVAFVLYLAMLFGPVQQLTTVFDAYQQAAVGLRRIGDLLTTPTSIVDNPDATATGSADFDGAVSLDGVGFRYTGADRAALSDVDLQVPPGGSLALVGATGAGKSTVVKLLARFYDPTSGHVRMDGVDLRDIGIARYRSRLGVVPQEPHLFAGDVADNIAFGRPDANREQIADAARRVGAAAMIASLPGGMAHPVSERGRSLSSGQRQLIALARAELVEPDLILLDEATATLDQATEAQVLAAGDALSRRRTSVIVAHRLGTAARADAIAVIDGGRVVEYGDHASLYDADGPYRRLWDAGIPPDAEPAEPMISTTRE
ncbi:ABC transporter ATP-binding protein/permease [Gordonia sp. HY002]|nr:ABC transporter ATP-binding protein [Gordonia zhenghanii]MCF8570608.1 ABC transporter ATP-binding protein/permease [Gordonia zhenghanii]MCF8605065.1 ABC transporter ATP-binding protein/permease [Gordonia zhenghanii]